MPDHDQLLLRLYGEAMTCDECAERHAFLRTAIRQAVMARRRAGLSVQATAAEVGRLLADVPHPALRPGRAILLRARTVQWVVESYLGAAA